MFALSPLRSPARRIGALVFFSDLLAVSIAAASHERTHKPQLAGSGFIAHEWGTFTSIAGLDGEAVQWLPLNAKSDLPSFVEHNQSAIGKGGLYGTVRME